MKISPETNAKLIPVLVENQGTLEIYNNGDIIERLPYLYSRYWKIGLQEAKRSLAKFHTTHMNSIRKRLGWKPSPHAERRKQLLIDRRKDQLSEAGNLVYKIAEQVAKEPYESKGVEIPDSIYKTLDRLSEGIESLRGRMESMSSQLDQLRRLSSPSNVSSTWPSPTGMKVGRVIRQKDLSSNPSS